MPQTTVKTGLTNLSKVNITQTVLLLKEAQSYLQEQMAKELFEQTTTKEEFLEQSENNFTTNAIINLVADALAGFKVSEETAIGMFNKLQDFFIWVDIYDAVEDAFCFYFLSINVDIETFTNPSSKKALQEHYKEVHSCYKEIILFIKNNKI